MNRFGYVTIYFTGICEDSCSHTYCQGGNPSHGGVQLNINNTCENYCVRTKKSSTKYIPGECVFTIPDKGVFNVSNCHPCKRVRIETLTSLIENHNNETILDLENGKLPHFYFF